MNHRARSNAELTPGWYLVGQLVWLLWCLSWRLVWRPLAHLVALLFRLSGIFLRDFRCEPIDRWTKWGGYVVLVVTAAVSVIRNHGITVDLDDVWAGAVQSASLAALNAPLAVLLSCAAMFVATRKGMRRTSLANLSAPAAKAFLFPAAAVGLLWGLKGVSDHLQADGQGGPPGGVMFLVLVGWIVALIFGVAVVWYAPRGLFGARDAHPHLRPLALIILTCAIFTENHLGVFSSIVMAVSRPERASLLWLSALGLLIPVGLAVLEIRWFVRCRGVSFRLPEPRLPFRPTWREQLADEIRKQKR